MVFVPAPRFIRWMFDMPEPPMRSSPVWITFEVPAKTSFCRGLVLLSPW